MGTCVVSSHKAKQDVTNVSILSAHILIPIAVESGLSPRVSETVCILTNFQIFHVGTCIPPPEMLTL